MNSINSLPSSNLAFPDLCSDSSGLIGQMYQPDASKPGASGLQSTYQGMSVQTLADPFPVYHNQSDINQNNISSFDLLHEYNIEPLTPADQAFLFGIDISDISQPVFEQELRPVAVVNPPNPNQATSNNQTPPGDDIAEDNSSAVEHKIESYYERRKKRYYNDQAYAERLRKLSREYSKERRKDPDYLELMKKRRRERYQNDPEYAERERERQRQRQRKLRKDPDFVERERKRQRKLRKDPDYLEQRRAYQNKRYHSQPGYKQRQQKLLKQLPSNSLYAGRLRSCKSNCVVYGRNFYQK